VIFETTAFSGAWPLIAQNIVPTGGVDDELAQVPICGVRLPPGEEQAVPAY